MTCSVARRPSRIVHATRCLHSFGQSLILIRVQIFASSVQQQLQYQMQMHVAQQMQLESANMEKDDGGMVVNTPICSYIFFMFLVLTEFIPLKAALAAVSVVAPNLQLQSPLVPLLGLAGARLTTSVSL